jgi:hypothetical protein
MGFETRNALGFDVDDIVEVLEDAFARQENGERRAQKGMDEGKDGDDPPTSDFGAAGEAT